MTRKTVSGIVVLGSLAGLAVAQTAGEPASCPAIDPAARTLSRPAAGLRAFRDPVTGKLRQPTSEEAAALARAEAEAAPERDLVFEVVVHPDGMKSVDLHGAFDVAAVATRNPDGSVTIRCVPARAAAANTAPPPPQALEEK